MVISAQQSPSNGHNQRKKVVGKLSLVLNRTHSKLGTYTPNTNQNKSENNKNKTKSEDLVGIFHPRLLENVQSLYSRWTSSCFCHPLRVKPNLTHVGTPSSNTGQINLIPVLQCQACSVLFVCACVLTAIFYDSVQCIWWDDKTKIM